MVLLLDNALVLACDDARSVLPNTSVAIDGGRITAIGDPAALRAAHPEAERVDLTGKGILPGFVNSHTHTVLTVLRGTVEDMSGDAIYGYMSPISFAMTPEERAAMATLGCLEAIRSGTTTLVDPFRHVTGYADAMIESGLRLYLSESAADALTLEIRRGRYVYDRAWGEAFLERTHDLIARYHGAADGRVTVQIAAHGPDNCSPWMLGELNALAARHGLRRTVHLSQSPGEVEQVRAAHGATSAQYLDRHGWLGPDVVAAHWTYCTAEDIALLAERGVHFAHCPASSSRRGPHRARADLAIDAGVNIALGTDNMSEDMFATMAIGAIVHRGTRGRSVNPQPQALLDGVTRNGAVALGELDQMGSVEVGKRADLAIIDLAHPVLCPTINLVSNIVHYGTPEIVESVVVGGEFVMRDRKVLTLDQGEVVRNAQAATEAAWARLLAAGDLATPRSTVPDFGSRPGR
ncbi:amidohydrolase family protein [Acuticoccus sediminis]|nr:amidohydrolase family protein [Acuticoccus sediminis]